MPTTKFSARSGIFFACLLLFIGPTFTRHQVAVSNRRVKVFGVEKYNPTNQNEYNKVWLETLLKDRQDVLVYERKEEMVKQAIARLQANDCIEELNLYGHGAPGFFCLGHGQSNSFVTSTYLVSHKNPGIIAEWQGALRPLKDRLCSGATVNLIGCNVGAGDEGADLLLALAQFLVAKVRGPVNLVIAGEDYNNHRYPVWQEAMPDKERPQKKLPEERPN